MQWLIPIATAIWAVWQWSQENAKDRQKEEERMVALYVNPFLSACEDLQSRIYNILEREGLHSLRKRYPDHTYAEETLYLIVRYFGWLATFHRYGAYTADPEVVRRTEAVRDAFANAVHPVGPFCFFRPEQKALGKIIMERFEGQYGVELDTIAFYDFKEQLEFPPLRDSISLRQSLEALRNAEDAANLSGRERLAEIQNHLVDFLDYVEPKVGLRFFTNDRKKCALFCELEIPPDIEASSPPSLFKEGEIE